MMNCVCALNLLKSKPKILISFDVHAAVGPASSFDRVFESSSPLLLLMVGLPLPPPLLLTDFVEVYSGSVSFPPWYFILCASKIYCDRNEFGLDTKNSATIHYVPPHHADFVHHVDRNLRTLSFPLNNLLKILITTHKIDKIWMHNKFWYTFISIYLSNIE